MFSWPSNGSVFPSWNYFSDRDDAEASGLAMARALRRFSGFLKQIRANDRAAILKAKRAGEVPDQAELQQCERKVHIVAHSMGNWALRHAINKFVIANRGTTPRLFDHAFLMAADEDEDALARRDKLASLLRLANHVHVYHASDDRALEISDRTKGNPDRLGAEGPPNLDALPDRVTALDCADVSDTVFYHGRHQYYRLRKEVIDDVVRTLRGEAQDGRKGRITLRAGRSWKLKPAK